MKIKSQSRILSLLLVVVMIAGMVPFSAVTANAAEGTVEVSTWEELKRALEYTTNCSVVKVVADIETKDLNGHTGLHQDNIIFMTMAMDKVLDLNGHTVNAYAKYYSEVAQGYLINICDKDARLTIRDSVGGGALIGEFNQEFYYEFINVSEGTLVMESGTVKMLCPSKDNQYTKCAISVSGTAVFNGGEVLTQVTSPGGEKEERYLSRRLQAIRGEKGGSVTINGGTFDRVVLHSAPTPENLGKYELVVNGGFFRQSIALILIGDVYASNFDHLPMQINDAYFMRSTDKLDPCRLVLGGKMKTFYDRNWDYDLLYNDIPGATLDDAKTMMWGLTPYLISENGAVFTDVHDGNWYVRGNMRRSVENGGPIMAFQGMSLGVQGGIARVISNAYGVKEVLLDGEPMACGERGFSAPQVDTTAESEHQVTFVMYPISPMLRVLGYSYSNEDSTGYIRMLVDDETGYGMVHYPDVPESSKEPFSVTYYINESNVDTLTTMELQYDLMLETNGVKKQVTTGYKGAKVAQWVDRTKAIDTIYLDISQPLVQGDYSSGTFTVDGSAPYTIEDRQGYWEHEDIWDLTGNGSVPAILGDQYYRFIRVYLKDGYEGYKFDKNNPPKVKIRGLNRECDSISVSVASDERSLGVSLASHPSELIQNAWGTVTGLRAGSLVDGVNIRPKDSYFDFEIKEIQRIKNGVVYSTNPGDEIDPDYLYRIKLVGAGKQGKTFSNGPEQYDITFHYYLNTNVKLRMNNDSDIAANYEEVLYDTASQAYTIDLVPEPDFVEYDYLSLGAPYPWAGSCPEFNNNWITGVPGGVMVRKYSWFDVSSGARMNETTPFAAGRSYRFEVILDCEEGYYLADPEVLDAYVNGEKAQVTEAAGNGTALTVEYSLAVSSGLHGQVVSFLDGSDVTVSLFAEGSAESKYTTTVPGGTKDSSGKYTTTYEIPEVAPGTYIMRVSKKNHVAREYTITVGAEAVTQDVQIHLKGDINGDGRINTSDVGKANAHAKGSSLLTDYQFACADINGDGKVNTSDVGKINAHARGKSLLW